ncbi:MAG: FAD-dependent oxidoreductase [Deltaproteobacteria bacterium]|nr:FAD-dependent oxidoreductase [Deltaproteobacteria bacterium]
MTTIAVVGAGINGLCTAFHLSRRGARVVLVDQFEAGHARGSSHGEERITRSSYEDPGWVADMQRCHAVEWPLLEAALGEVLVYRGGDAVFFGPESGPIAAYARAVAAVGAPVEQLDPAEARRRFPGFTFAGSERVLQDRSAGVLAAGATVRGLSRWLERAGVELRRPFAVEQIESRDDGVYVAGPERLRADFAVVAAGPWARRLAPGLAVRPARQHVGYWQLPAAKAGRFPAWVHLGPGELHYGLPTIEGGAMKAAFHDHGAGPGDDPGDDASPSAGAVEAVESRLREWLTGGPGPVLRRETCFYTNAEGDQFLAGWTSDRVYTVSACSGHAFKLAPLTGRRAAEAVWLRAR